MIIQTLISHCYLEYTGKFNKFVTVLNSCKYHISGGWKRFLFDWNIACSNGFSVAPVAAA